MWGRYQEIHFNNATRADNELGHVSVTLQIKLCIELVLIYNASNEYSSVFAVTTAI
jgi:hypothetical protein